MPSDQTFSGDGPRHTPGLPRQGIHPLVEDSPEPQIDDLALLEELAREHLEGVETGAPLETTLYHIENMHPFMKKWLLSYLVASRAGELGKAQSIAGRTLGERISFQIPLMEQDDADALANQRDFIDQECVLFETKEGTPISALILSPFQLIAALPEGEYHDIHAFIHIGNYLREDREMVVGLHQELKALLSDFLEKIRNAMNHPGKNQDMPAHIRAHQTALRLRHILHGRRQVVHA